MPWFLVRDCVRSVVADEGINCPARDVDHLPVQRELSRTKERGVVAGLVDVI